MSRTTRTPGLSHAAMSRRAALASLLVLPLAACSASAEGDAEEPADATATGTLTVTDPWVKAAENGMTAAFGTIVNGTGTDLVLTAVTTPATETVELHETTADGSGGMSMQEKEGGFELPAGAELVLEPGGEHIMLMDLPGPLRPGDEVELTLVFSEGTEHPFTATVKDFAGAQEHYAPGEGGEASDGGGEHADSDGTDGTDGSDGGGEHAGHGEHE